jgi:TonB-linked SusC/RagA family outer membrane protein
MKKITTLFVLLCLGIFTLMAQNKTVNGTVTSNTDNLPLPGVTVMIKGSKTGTITDLEGKFQINASPTDVLVFTSIGMKAEKRTVGKSTILNISLTEDVTQLNEVVAIGYGTTKKADLTSAISTLSAKDVLKMPGSVTDALQGSVAGVQITAGTIRIRGVGSITGGTDPLWVVDGLIGGSVPNENEIETIQVLKDAASCAIYGVRGSNGVIIVTTKQGAKGKIAVEYNGNIGTAYPWKTLSMMDASDYGNYVNELFYNYYGAANYTKFVPLHDQEPTKPLANSNWQDAWFQRSIYQKHNISVSGGNDNLTFRGGLTYSDYTGVVRESGGDSKGAYANAQLKKGIFTFGMIFNAVQNYNYSGGGGYTNLLTEPSNIPIYDKTSSTGYNITGTAADGNDMVNQVALLHLLKNQNQDLGVKGTAWTEIAILPFLKYKLTYGYDLDESTDYGFQPMFDLGKSVNLTAYLNEDSYRTDHYTVENTLSLDKTIKKHHITALLGTTYETTSQRQFGAKGQSINQDLTTMSNYQLSPGVNGSAYQDNLFSYLGRIMYSYNNRYLITANLRVDKTSRFAPGKQTGVFPSFSAGWRISEEDFMKDVNWVSNLKLRATYGWMGNYNIGGYYNYQSTVNTANEYYTLGPTQSSDASNVPAPLVTTIASPDLTWETTRDAGFGIDADFFKNRLSLVFDYYNRLTSNMLLQENLPLSAGTTQPLAVNTGLLNNQGVELTITYRDKIGDLSYSISPNVSINKNKVVSMPLPQSSGNNITLTQTGSQVGQFYGYKTAGLFKTWDEVNNYTYKNPTTGAVSLIQPNAAPGDIKFLDLNHDGSIDDGDKTFIGSPIPTASFGINFNLEYKGFDFSMMWQGDYGNQIYNNGKTLVMSGFNATNQMTDMLNRFRLTDVTLTTPGGAQIILPANTNTGIPRAVLNDPNGNMNKVSDYFIEDGSYLRCKRITVGYTIPPKISKKMDIDKFRIYAGTKNPFTFTKYSFFDPEVLGMPYESGGANLNRGIDFEQGWSTASIATREFFVGVELAF